MDDFASIFEKDKPEEIPDEDKGATGESDSVYACTIVTLIPKVLYEEKPHLIPGVYRIPAAPSGDISVFYVGEAMHFIPDPFSPRNIRQNTSPNEMARSICDDYKGAHIGLSAGAEPGLFWIEGRYTKEEVKIKFKRLVDAAREKQKRWFLNMIALADADWQKNKNMLAVSDLQRLAAREMNINKEWVNFVPSELFKCPYCTVAISPEAIVCPNCREVINKVAYNKMKSEVAGV